MAHSLNDLSALKDEVLDEGQLTSLDDMKEVGNFLPMLQPGTYSFRTPENMADLSWDTIDKEGEKQRIYVKFDDHHPLIITAAPQGSEKRVGEPFTPIVNNVPRERTLSGEKVSVIDLRYLLKKLGEKTVPNMNREYLLALSKHPGKEFKSAINVSWSCNPNRDVRMWVPDPTDPTGQKGERKEIPGQKGCGARYYPDGKIEGQAGVKYPTKGPDGLYPEEIVCAKCRALVRGFANLDLVREA